MINNNTTPTEHNKNIKDYIELTSDLVFENQEKIPNGDYVEMCRMMREMTTNLERNPAGNGREIYEHQLDVSRRRMIDALNREEEARRGEMLALQRVNEIQQQHLEATQEIHRLLLQLRDHRIPPRGPPTPPVNPSVYTPVIITRVRNPRTQRWVERSGRIGRMIDRDANRPQGEYYSGPGGVVVQE